VTRFGTQTKNINPGRLLKRCCAQRKSDLLLTDRRTVDQVRLGRLPAIIVCRECVKFREFRRPQSQAPLSQAVQKLGNEGSKRVR